MSLRPILRAGILAAISVAIAAAQPALSAQEQATWIATAREQALAYVRSLPDFLCTEVTRRYSAPPAEDSSWKLTDRLTVRLSYFDQKEDYRVIRINDKPVDRRLGNTGGFTVQGDFGTMLKNIFTPKSETQFTWERWDTWKDRRVAVFGYRIERAHSEFNSSWQGFLKRGQAIWGAKGFLEIDAENRQVLRATVDSIDMPANSVTHEVHLALDYDYQKIGDREFLLPAHSLTVMTFKSGRAKLDSDFTEYRKFSADTKIEFGK